MTFTRAEPLGWGLFELLRSSHVNHIDSQLPYAVDGRGGSYSMLEPLLLNGSSVSGGSALVVTSGSASEPALNVLQEGAGGVAEFQSMDPTGAHRIVEIHGADCNASFISETMRVEGRNNAAGDGGDGLYLTGGNTSSPGADGGDGLSVDGGSADAGGMGGFALVARGGSSNFASDAGVSRFGRTAMKVMASYTYGADLNLHYGSPAAEFYGSETEGGGKGGPGIYAEGGLGSTNAVGGPDSGAGVVGLGGNGVIGISAGAPFNFRPPPSEFIQTPRAAVRAMSKNAGRGVLSEVSGYSADADLNLFRYVGTAITSKTLLKIESAPDNAPGGLSIGLQITSGVNAGQFRGAQIGGRGAHGLSVSSTPDESGNSFPSLILTGQTALPNQGSPAGLFSAAGSTVPNAGPNSLLMMGMGTGVYDRLLGSSDSAAAWAWARIRTNGAGGVSILSDYGVASVAFNGDYSLSVTLDTTTGGPTNANNMVAVATSNNDPAYGGSNASGWCQAVVIDGTHVNLSMKDGSAINFATSIVEISLVVHAIPAYGRPTNRPTFYKPSDLV